MNLRIEKAKTLLKNGDIQVSEVAAEAGYGDPLAFSKVFKARTGEKCEREYKEEKRKLVVKGKKGDDTEFEDWFCDIFHEEKNSLSVPEYIKFWYRAESFFM